MIPIPIRDSLRSSVQPLVTLVLVGLCTLIYLWDRGFSPFGPSYYFADLAMRPSEVTLIFSGQGSPPELGRIFTSLFLHGGLLHLALNMIYLLAFGPTVERTLGGWRFSLYYLFWGVVAAIVHTLVFPHSDAYLQGASGAIGGIMGVYFLLYPSSRIEVMLFPIFWWTFRVPAGVLIGLWFVLQLVFPQEGVANWAHVGGFLAGLLTVMVLGGRTKALQTLKPQWETDEPRPA